MVSTRNKQSSVQSDETNMTSSNSIPTKNNNQSPTSTMTPLTSFHFQGVNYATYDEMVQAKRKRNNDMLISSGLLDASKQFRNTTMKPITNSSKSTTSGIVPTGNKRKSESNDSRMLRRKSNRLAGIKSDGLYVEEERAGGKVVTNQGTQLLSVPDESAYSYYNERVNDGSDLSISQAVELSGTKWVHEHSVSSATKFIDSFAAEDMYQIKARNQQIIDDDIVSQIQNMNVDDLNCVAKVVPDRIYSVVFHPSHDKLLAVAGDKVGHVGFWDATSEIFNSTEDKIDDDSNNPSSQPKNDNSVHLFKPHGRPVNNLQWDSHGTKLYSSSYDGTIRCFDLHKQLFTQVFATYDTAQSEHKNELGYGLDSDYMDGRNYWMQYHCLDHRNDNCLFFSTSIGSVTHIDLRNKGQITFNKMLSQKKINTVSLHPNGYSLATCGLDYNVQIWDIRKFDLSSSSKRNQTSTIKPITTQQVGRSINSAFFSSSGKYLLSTTMNDTLDIISDAHTISSKTMQPTYRIRHDNKTGRYLSTFMAQWHPNSGLLQKELFVVGSMKKPRTMDVFGVDDKDDANLIRGIQGDALTAVVSRCAYHPRTDRIISMGGNSSGRVTIFS